MASPFCLNEYLIQVQLYLSYNFNGAMLSFFLCNFCIHCVSIVNRLDFIFYSHNAFMLLGLSDDSFPIITKKSFLSFGIKIMTHLVWTGEVSPFPFSTNRKVVPYNR